MLAEPGYFDSRLTPGHKDTGSAINMISDEEAAGLLC